MSIYAMTSVSLGLIATALFVKASVAARLGETRTRWFWATSGAWWTAAAVSITRALGAEPFVLTGVMFVFVSGLQLVAGVLLNPPLFDWLHAATRRPDQR
ncbi:hypothetical protein ACIGO9_29740 [Nocardia asteroides]|uniref:hypothetical protein n=1 Tax=Nocardia asteroides TaxID=1824 RepID=UPI0037C8DD54